MVRLEDVQALVAAMTHPEWVERVEVTQRYSYVGDEDYWDTLVVIRDEDAQVVYEVETRLDFSRRIDEAVEALDPDHMSITRFGLAGELDAA